MFLGKENAAGGKSKVAKKKMGMASGKKRVRAGKVVL